MGFMWCGCCLTWTIPHNFSAKWSLSECLFIFAALGCSPTPFGSSYRNGTMHTRQQRPRSMRHSWAWGSGALLIIVLLVLYSEMNDMPTAWSLRMTNEPAPGRSFAMPVAPMSAGMQAAADPKNVAAANAASTGTTTAQGATSTTTVAAPASHSAGADVRPGHVSIGDAMPNATPVPDSAYALKHDLGPPLVPDPQQDARSPTAKVPPASPQSTHATVNGAQPPQRGAGGAADDRSEEPRVVCFDGKSPTPCGAPGTGGASEPPRAPSEVHWTVRSNAHATRPPLHTIPWRAPDGRADAMNAVLDNQFVPDCGARHMLVYSITREGQFGLFSVVNQLMAALALALHMNRTLVFVTQGDEPWMYAPRRLCSDADGLYQPWNCYFEPISNCEIRRDRFVGRPNGHRYTRLATLEEHWVRAIQTINMNIVFGRSLFGALVEIPPLHSRAELQRLAPLAAYLFRPVAAIREHHQRLKRWLGLDRVPYVAVHVRRTDKAREEFLYNPHEYLELLLPLPHRHVFIMTDDPSVAGALQEISDRTGAGFRFYHSPQLRPREGATPAMIRDSSATRSDAASAPEFPVVRHTVEFVADCMIAAEATFFVGSCGSNVDRILPELLAARTARYPLNATALLLARRRCRYWAKDWARDPALFSRRTQYARDTVLTALDDEMLSDKQIGAIKSMFGRRGDEGGNKVAALVAEYERTMADPTIGSRIRKLVALKERLDSAMVLTVPSLRPVECDVLTAQNVSGKALFKGLFDKPRLVDADITALRCLLRNATSAWEQRLDGLLQLHASGIRSGNATAVAETKVQTNKYWCALMPGPMASRCAASPYAEDLGCGQRPSQKNCAAMEGLGSVKDMLKLRWKIRKAYT